MERFQERSYGFRDDIIDVLCTVRICQDNHRSCYVRLMQNTNAADGCVRAKTVRRVRTNTHTHRKRWRLVCVTKLCNMYIYTYRVACTRFAALGYDDEDRREINVL